ncbi:hypothetical protein [Cecembia sp.]|uniref:hypothetical protein n=1 Tax=Cecembia sp. TaxID=1898110 RepID=UPI0025B8841C|nr:hypothetical protein [Cecembia sp.]
MKYKNKLILANVLALLAVVTIVSVSSLLGVEIGGGSPLLLKLLLVLVPQVGFIYFYLKVSAEEKKRSVA